jgi:hypothetical protein
MAGRVGPVVGRDVRGGLPLSKAMCMTYREPIPAGAGHS